MASAVPPCRAEVKKRPKARSRDGKETAVNDREAGPVVPAAIDGLGPWTAAGLFDPDRADAAATCCAADVARRARSRPGRLRRPRLRRRRRARQHALAASGAAPRLRRGGGGHRPRPGAVRARRQCRRLRAGRHLHGPRHRRLSGLRRRGRALQRSRAVALHAGHQLGDDPHRRRRRPRCSGSTSEPRSNGASSTSSPSCRSTTRPAS